MDVPVAARFSRPAWVNARTVLGLCLMAVAFLGGQRVLSQARTTVAYWSAAADLPRGAEVTPEDLVVSHVKLPAANAGRYVPSSEPIVGMRVERAVLEGELLPTAWLSSGSSLGPAREMTVPVPPEHAVGGDLDTGDIVDIYATFSPEGAEAKTTLIVRGVEVLDVVEAGGLVLEEQAKIGITVMVTPEESTRLTFAIRTAEIDVVRVVGDEGERPARAVTGSDL